MYLVMLGNSKVFWIACGLWGKHVGRETIQQRLQRLYGCKLLMCLLVRKLASYIILVYKSADNKFGDTFLGV